MPKHSHREKILSEGMRVVHAQGFGAASVRDIVQAACVPQGSFTNHFASKEAFGLAVIDRYFANTCQLLNDTLRNDALAPLERLGAYIDTNIAALNRYDMRNGCLFGNFTAEASEHSELIRLRLNEIFAELSAALGYCLKAAVAAREIPQAIDCDEMAAFVLAALQGATLLAKAARSPAPLERVRKMLFATLLR